MVNETVINAQDARKERFEFVLTINDFIVCQRYFKIPAKVRTSALHSEEMLDTLNYCVSLIQADLRNKSNLYYHYTAPQIFNTMEEFENWIPNNKLDVPTYVLFRDNLSVHTWDGEALKPYDRYFNVNDYVTPKDVEEVQNTLKFEVLDSGKPIYSRIWDANVYPRFIRNNIDLSNSKNKYSFEEKPFEHLLVKLLNKDRHDLVSKIINEICDLFVGENTKFTYKLKYGKTVYKTFEKTFNVNEQINQ